MTTLVVPEKVSSCHWQWMGDKMAPEFLEVPGAGAEHRIDAVAEFCLTPISR